MKQWPTGLFGIVIKDRLMVLANSAACWFTLFKTSIARVRVLEPLASLEEIPGAFDFCMLSTCNRHLRTIDTAFWYCCSTMYLYGQRTRKVMGNEEGKNDWIDAGRTVQVLLALAPTMRANRTLTTCWIRI